MTWEHYTESKTGRTVVLRTSDGKRFPCTYRLENIHTGKSRVFWGMRLFVMVEGTETEARLKGDYGSLSPLLDTANGVLEGNGWVLQVAGNAEGYHESGLSGPSGYGYVSHLQREAFFILDPVPEGTRLKAGHKA